MFSQYNVWLSVFVAMHRTLRFLLSVSGIKSEYIGLFLILLIGLPLFFGYLKLRVHLVNEPFSLAWPVIFSELEPPVDL